MKVFVVIPKTFAGCGFYRLYQPHNHLAKNYGVEVTFGTHFIKNNHTAYLDHELQEFDIIVWHKTYFELDDIRRMNNLGIPTVIDFDDHWVVNREHSLYKQYTNEGLTTKLHRALMLAQYVTCTTEILAEEIWKVNQNIEILPNAIDMEYDSWKKQERVKEKDYVFGYLGGPCHIRDVGLMRGLQKRLTETEHSYQVRLFGYNGTDIYNHYAKVLSDDRRSQHFTAFKGADIFNYPQFYNYMDCSLVPLEDNKFNSSKSPLKLIEAGFFKKPAIVSNVEPYKELAQYCFSVETRSDWYNHARELIRNPELGVEMGFKLYEQVQRYDIKQVNKKRFKFYQDVCFNNHTNSSQRSGRVAVEHG